MRGEALEFRVGMVVRSSEGDRLGEVLRRDAGYFVIVRGFRRYFFARYDEIAAVRGGEVWLDLTRRAFLRENWDNRSYPDRIAGNPAEARPDEAP
jgi:hypothetical protein